MTRITEGANVLQHEVNTSAPTVDLTALKLLVNSVVSAPDSKFMTINIKNYCLATTLSDNQHMLILQCLVLEDMLRA